MTGEGISHLDSLDYQRLSEILAIPSFFRYN